MNKPNKQQLCKVTVKTVQKWNYETTILSSMLN